LGAKREVSPCIKKVDKLKRNKKMRKIGKCRDEKRKRFRDCGKQIKDENERP
jgi:hypothetical protein